RSQNHRLPILELTRANFGPERSTSTESGRFSFEAAARARLISSAFSSCVPCDMLMRTPFAPAVSSASITPGSRDAGPSVARIFAFLIVNVSPEFECYLIQPRYYCRNATSIRLKLQTKCFPQQPLFATNSNCGPEKKHNKRHQQCGPVTHRDAGCDQHSEHPCVDRMTHETIRAFRRKFVIRNYSGRDTPLLAQRFYCRHYDEDGNDRRDNCDDPEEERQSFAERNEGANEWTTYCPDDGVRQSLQKDSGNRTSVSLAIRRCRWFLAQDKRQGEHKPAHHDHH